MRKPLTRERVAMAGISIADSEGLDAVSMRRVARLLDVSTMSSYRHVTDRDDLLVAMVDEITRQTTLPDHPDASWRDVLRVMALGDWQAFSRHRWLIEVWSTPRRRVDLGSVGQLETVLSHLEAAGMGGTTGHEVVLGVAGLTLGMAALNIDEPGERLRSGVDLQAWRSQSADDLAATHPDHPRAAGFLDSWSRLSAEDIFAAALESFLVGLEVRHAASPTTRRRP